MLGPDTGGVVVGGEKRAAVSLPRGWINKGMLACRAVYLFEEGATEDWKGNELIRQWGMDNTVDSSVSMETTELKVHGWGGISTLHVCTEYEYAETPKHMHTNTHPYSLLTRAIFSQTLVWQGNTGKFLESCPQLPVKPETWVS